MPASNASLTAMNVLTAPTVAFAALRERPTFLLPLLLLLAAAASTTFIYMNGVDIEWFFEQQAQRNPNVTEEQVAAFGRFLSRVPQAGVAVVLALFGVMSVGVLLLLQSFYFKIVTWVTRDGLSYQHWFSMVAWCALPSLLTSLASMVNLLTSDVSLMPQQAINPLSFANLAGLDYTADGAGRLLAGYDPIRLWSLVLMALCYRAFTGRPLIAAAGIVALPTLVIALLTLIS